MLMVYSYLGQTLRHDQISDEAMTLYRAISLKLDFRKKSLNFLAMTSIRNQQKGGSIRKGTLIKKAHELGSIPGFEVALFIRKGGRITTFRSIDDESWWPNWAEIVRNLSMLRL